MSIYAVTHLHEYGSTAYLVSSETVPTSKQLVRELGINFEPNKSESLEVNEISDDEYRHPKQLAWHEGDEEEFDECAVDDNEDSEESPDNPKIG